MYIYLYLKLVDLRMCKIRRLREGPAALREKYIYMYIFSGDG